MKFLRRALYFFGIAIVTLVVFFNLRLYTPSPLPDNDESVPPTLVAQLSANRAALDAGTASEMQELFPEGYYFSYLFHGLTWVELAMRDESFVNEAIAEAEWCYAKIDSPAGRAPFPEELLPDHGMFYSSWKAHLLAGIAVLEKGKNKTRMQQLQHECDALKTTFQESLTPFPPSYRGVAWPCDSFPGVHAMSVHDRLAGNSTNDTAPRYEGFINEIWLPNGLERLDPATELFPHMADLPDGRAVSGARATSQVIVLRYLPDIHPELAKEHYTKFRERFATTFLGAPCVLEYPSGVQGRGDVDSGPLIFGRSLVGTVVMMGIAQMYGDNDFADSIAQCGETVGLPWTSGEQKTYFGGVLPIGNIIVAYAHVARPWFAENQHHPDHQHAVSRFWRLPIHGLSLLFFAPSLYRVVRRRRRGAGNEETPTTNSPVV